MKYLLLLLKEMNVAATGQNERRSEMSISNQPPKGLGAASKQDEGRLEENGGTARHASPEKATHKHAGAKAPAKQLPKEADAGDIDPSLRASFELDPQTGENEKFMSGRIDSAEITTCGFGLWHGSGYGRSFHGSVNKKELEKALERLKKTPIPPALNTLADQVRRGKRRR